MTEYERFLLEKIPQPQASGFEIARSNLSPKLYPFQADIVQWALRRGKAALFEECGLGKTFQQLEWARLVAAQTEGRVLVLAPLAVAGQTVAEGALFGIETAYCRSQEEADERDVDIIITNYEMIESFDASRFAGVALDESSILKAFTGKRKRLIIETFRDTPYKLACSATPAPNDFLELGNHAEFLDVMPSNEMIMRWFINDTMSAGNYRLKGHSEDDFWKWVSSWAVLVSRPSDLGYPDEGYALPHLILHDEVVPVDYQRIQREQGRLIASSNLSATTVWRERKKTMPQRCQRAAEIVRSNLVGTWIVWCETNAEADLLKKLLPMAVEVRGAHSIKQKEQRLNAFSCGEARIIITKPSIAGYGLNWQHCLNQVFVGIGYSFEKFYQAVRRSWRYGVSGEVHAYLVYAESEGNVVAALRRKQEAHQQMQERMSQIVTEHGLQKRLDRSLQIADSKVASGNGWKLHLGDCVEVSKSIESNSIGFSVFSPPFANLYIYSDALADMGNCKNANEFIRHYRFLAQELHRITQPGRLCAIHCKDLPLYKNRDGAAGLYDFPADIRAAMEQAGWTYHSRVTIWKDPVIEMQRTKNHGLLHRNFAQRGEVVRQGMPDYIIVFRKWTDDMPDKQIEHKPVPGDYIGTCPPESWRNQRDYSIQTWQRYASPVWFDIQQTNVLNHRIAREDKDEKHICPLQLDVIERCIWLWSNEGDAVFSPFTGVGSEGYVALKMKRRFVGAELKEAYWKTAQRNLKDAVRVSTQRTLFDLL